MAVYVSKQFDQYLGQEEWVWVGQLNGGKYESGGGGICRFLLGPVEAVVTRCADSVYGSTVYGLRPELYPVFLFGVDFIKIGETEEKF